MTLKGQYCAPGVCSSLTSLLALPRTGFNFGIITPTPSSNVTATQGTVSLCGVQPSLCVSSKQMLGFRTDVSAFSLLLSLA